MNVALPFYTEVLPFLLEDDFEISGSTWDDLVGLTDARARIVRLRLGNEKIELIDYLEVDGKPVPLDSRSNDLWFQHIAIVVSDMDAAYSRLQHYDVAHVSPSPQRLPDWNPNAGGITAFYFADPEGHVLELIQYPSDKGQERWHRSAGGLFLGFDHTAIGVEETARSLSFYRDALGLAVAGTSENFGEEQERLNNVTGAHLQITGLSAGSGPGIEFLDYIRPEDGRPYPTEATAADLVHWVTTLRVEDLKDAAARIEETGGRIVSKRLVKLPDVYAGEPAHALLARDPDGHALLLVERIEK